MTRRAKPTPDWKPVPVPGDLVDMLDEIEKTARRLRGMLESGTWYGWGGKKDVEAIARRVLGAYKAIRPWRSPDDAQELVISAVLVGVRSVRNGLATLDRAAKQAASLAEGNLRDPLSPDQVRALKVSRELMRDAVEAWLAPLPEGRPKRGDTRKSLPRAVHALLKSLGLAATRDAVRKKLNRYWRE
jgi:hypothetical protein